MISILYEELYDDNHVIAKYCYDMRVIYLKQYLMILIYS